ncbi:MAG TPA: acetyltransferase [Thermoanaerobaculia bacterium]|nr:acetyltransferase [Thermoanaerobaculia bacterium]
MTDAAACGPSPQLVLVGDSAFAEVAYEYFTHDSPYEVAGFAVERAFRRRDDLFGVPVVDFETMEERFPPATHDFYAALVYTQGNALRRRLYEAAKAKGYRPASYVSSRAFVWRNVELGEHCFVFENNVVQPFVKLGNDVVLWSGNHIGHHSSIGDHCFISSHVVVSGFVHIGKSCFLGVNSTFANNLEVGNGCVIGAGALVLGDVADGETVVGVKKRSKS